MKRIYLFGMALAAYTNLYAQSLSENFDGFTAGDYIGVVSPDITTWSGTEGGTEDVFVTSDESFSGSNSIYLSTTVAAGGPQDLVIPFGGKHTTGTFNFKAMFFVEDGKGAYFNFQGEESVGDIWSMNCQMVNDNRLLIDVGGPAVIETTYESDTWFELEVAINLNTNEWELLIDGGSEGVFSATNNAVASVNIYPVNAASGGNNQAGYYMDDIEFEHVAYTLPSRNGGVIAISNTSGLATTGITPSAVVRNLGTSTINSFDLDITYNGTTISEEVTGVSVSSLDTYTVDFSDAVTLIAGENDIVATISNVNATAADDDGTDDTKTVSLNPVVPAAGKVVVGEEATGTWCPWCPRGAVYLDRMAESYPDHFIGIAVHNGDPMTVEDYDAAIGTLVGGYPSMLVDRGADIDPSEVEGDLLSRVVIAPTAVFTSIVSDYTPGATTANISFSVTFNTSVSGDYRLACVVTEDHVTGEGSGYNQANAYAGGGAGEMGGYETLPNPVPAADMVYDHVARGVWPSFAGKVESFPTDMAAGETYTVSFEVPVGEDWDVLRTHIVGLLIDPSGDIDNAGSSLLDQVSGIAEDGLVNDLDFSLYPNPATSFANVSLGMIDNSPVSIVISDLNGRLVANRNYGKLSGDLILPIDLSTISTGIYTVQVVVGERTVVKKLIVE